MGGTPRLVFANQLRGIAALAVVVSHLVGVFWWSRDFIALATSTPVQQGTRPGFTAIVASPWFMAGPFGVALFFLISGLVIPFSLDRLSTRGFLLARILRIYPTYIAALLIEILVLHLNGWFWNKQFPYSTGTILANLLLVHTVSGSPSIDLVNWSLSIELKFYMIAALVAPALRRRKLWLPVAIGSVLTVIALLLRLPSPGSGVVASSFDTVRQTLRMESVYLVFMLIGMLFTLRLRSVANGGLTVAGLLGSIMVLLVLFVFCWRIGPQAEQYPIVLFNYGYALMLFSASFLFRKRIRRAWLLDRLADISYPIYVVHMIVGASIMKLLLLRFGWSPLSCLITALISVLALAIILHRLVERPSISIGRTLAKACSR